MNGSPLFTGDAGSGESEIRRFVLENDLLETLIALPEQLFYNTGIATFIWVVTSRKAPKRRGIVQLIDATSFWVPMKKSLGDKRRVIPLERSKEILAMHADFEDGELSKLFPTTHFGYRKITVERPLRLNFQASEERVARLEDERGFRALAESKKKGAAGAKEAADGRARQDVIRAVMHDLPPTPYEDRDAFEKVLADAARKAGVKLAAAESKAILSALSERDETAEICRDRNSKPESDPELRDTESVPLAESIEAFFAREVNPHVPDAWIDTDKRDERDHAVGIVGYEINFNRYFYKYTPPRPIEVIEEEIRAIETDIVRMLGEVTGAVTKGSDANVPMKDSGVEWLGTIPSHWKLKRLWHLTPSGRRIMYGIVLPGPNVDRGVPIVKGGDVSPERLRLDRLNQTTAEIEASYQRSRLRGGDLVYAIRGSIGEVATVPNELDGANLTQDVARIAFTPATHGPWLLHALKSRAVFAQLDAGALGATIRGINIRDLKRAWLPVPPRSEQEAIARFLEHHTAKLDALTLQVNSAIDRLEELRTALISAAVTGKIDVRDAMPPA